MEGQKGLLNSASAGSVLKKKKKGARRLQPLKQKKKVTHAKTLTTSFSDSKLGVEKLLEKTVNIASAVGLPRTLTLTEAQLKKLDKQSPTRKEDWEYDSSDGESMGSMSSAVREYTKVYGGRSHGHLHNHNCSAYSDMMSVNSSHGHTALDSINSELTSATLNTKISTKMLLAEIQKSNLQHNLQTPSFVTPLPQLSPVYVSWNKKATKENKKIDIIGMYQPIPLILAKADRRIKRAKQAQDLHLMQLQKKSEEMESVIEWKQSRAERYAIMLQVRTIATFWLKNVYLAKYLLILYQRYVANREADKRWRVILSSASKISKFYFRWYRKHLTIRLDMRVTAAFTNSTNIFKLYFRIYRRKRATHIIKTFLHEYRNHHKMNVVIHRYLSAVKSVQRFLRKCLKCKRARERALYGMWYKYEYAYIRRKLEEKKQKQKSTNDNKHNKGMLDSSLALLSTKENAKLLIEMKFQNKSWQKIDSHMEKIISELKTSGGEEFCVACVVFHIVLCIHRRMYCCTVTSLDTDRTLCTLTLSWVVFGQI